MGGCVLRGGFDIGARGAAAALRDIVGDGFVEQERLLCHERNMFAQRGERDVADVLSVDGNGAAIDIVKAQQQIEQRGLARAGWANERDLLTRLHIQRNGFQRQPIGVVGKIHPLEAHRTPADIQRLCGRPVGDGGF